MAVAVWTSLEQLTTDGLVVLNGGSVTVYAATTTTPLSLFSNVGLSTPAANPIVLDSAGRHAMTYFSPVAYKTLIKNSVGATIQTRDSIDPGVPLGTGALAIANGGTGAITAPAALAALGGATAAELADVAADVAAVVGSLGSVEKTHIATGSVAQRPASPLNGDMRRNTDTSRWEGYNGGGYENFVTSTEFTAAYTAILASKSQQETGTSTATGVAPSNQQHHKSASKGWAKVNFAGAALRSYNVSSVTDTGTGQATINWTTAFADADYCAVATAQTSSGMFAEVQSITANAVLVASRVSNTGTATDATALHVAAFGVQ